MGRCILDFFCFFLEIRKLRQWDSLSELVQVLYAVELGNECLRSMCFPPFYMGTSTAQLRCGVEILQAPS